MTKIQAAIERYVEDRDSLSDDELAELIEAVAASPELLLELKSQLMIAEMLGQQLAVDRSDFRAQVDQRIRDYQRGEVELDQRAVELRALAQGQLQEAQLRLERRQWMRLWLGVAAMLLIAAGGYYAYLTAPQWRSIARVDRFSGELLLHRRGEKIPVRAAFRVYYGDRIETATAGAFEVVYADGVKVQVNGSTDIEFCYGESSLQKVLQIRRGDVAAQVTPQQKPLLVETDQAIARVLGTEFFLATDRDSTRLEVHQGKVELEQPKLLSSVIVGENELGMASASGVTVSPITWPGDQKDLTFVFQTARQARWARTSSGAIQSYNLQPAGSATWNSHFAMKLQDGSFTVPPEAVAGVVAATTASGALSIQATLTPAAESTAEIASIVTLFDEHHSLALAQRGSELLLRLQCRDHADELVIGSLQAGAPTHVAVSLSETEFSAYLNGQKSARGTFDLQWNNWRQARFRFGEVHDVNPAWPGSLEGVACYSRALEAEEIAQESQRYLDEVRSRPHIPQAELIAIWNRGSQMPRPSEYAPGDAALMVRGLDVVRVLRNELFDESIAPGGQVLAADWAVLNGLRQPIANAKTGQAVRVVLEPFNDNPQLWGHVCSDDFQSDADRARPRYFIVSVTPYVAGT
ncbi:FecR domain-containing protein [Lignipirellula cremea]|uniref:Fec operon regulator FecR n=1 Tax=Lignipirellula cremea TaxID=2528010 RepID=A0A518DWZ0_9BACT|nr:FecR domain-containing protein [Lignipirellula cremea]QDU96351.1 fec operon regulator FecR [Lignipirellula cremea]